jgi:hypothetical protein
MTGAERRAFMAEMALKYCSGSARLAETVFSWGRETVEVGLARLSQLDLFKKHNLLISLTSAYGSLHYKKKATLSG